MPRYIRMGRGDTEMTLIDYLFEKDSEKLESVIHKYGIYERTFTKEQIMQTFCPAEFGYDTMYDCHRENNESVIRCLRCWNKAVENE